MRRVWLWTPLVLALCHAHAIASVQIVNILVDPIKGSLGVTDTQYSLLQGAALGLLAVVLGVPIARIADSGRRRNVIALGTIAWSLGSLLSAVAQTFTHLLIARAFVGIGEIVLFPAALSIIYDSAPRERLATAIRLKQLAVDRHRHLWLRRADRIGRSSAGRRLAGVLRIGRTRRRARRGLALGLRALRSFRNSGGWRHALAD